MRISGVYPASQGIIEEILSNPARYPYITECEDNAYFWWQGSGDYFERYYNNFRTRDDDGMAEIFIDHLKMMEDPRLAVVAKPAKNDGEYRGFENGAAAAPASIHDISRIGVKYREDPAGFSPFYRACENYFIMAEAALNGWNVPMSAEEAYEQGVRLSMEDNDLDATTADAYLAGKGKWNGTKDRLYFEWWVALFKQNIEAWSLYRRTGYPTYIHTAKALTESLRNIRVPVRPIKAYTTTFRSASHIPRTNIYITKPTSLLPPKVSKTMSGVNRCGGTSVPA